jgi:flagellar protein FliS
MNAYVAYRKGETLTDTDDKPRILIRVFEQMLKRLDDVERAIGEKNYQKKFEQLQKVIRVLELLDASLDRSYKDIAENLSALYRYIIGRLRQVHVTLNRDTIEESRLLLQTIMEGFRKAYEVEARRKPATEAGQGLSSPGRVSLHLSV